MLRTCVVVAARKRSYRTVCLTLAAALSESAFEASVTLYKCQKLSKLCTRLYEYITDNSSCNGSEQNEIAVRSANFVPFWFFFPRKQNNNA